MANPIPNLDAVYNKWASKNPYSRQQNGKVKRPEDTKTYNAVIEQGKSLWNKKFTDVGPPPIRPDGYRQRTKKHNRHNNTDLFPRDAYNGVNNLASFKLMPMVMPMDERSRRPYMGRCCACMPNSKLEHHEDGVENEPLHDILRVHTCDQRNGWWMRTFYHVSYVMQRDVSHKYPDVSIAVLTSDKIIEAVQKSALQELGAEEVEEVDIRKLKKEMAKQRKRTRGIVKNMKAVISNGLIRLTGWFLHKLLGRLFSSVVVHSGQMKVLSNVCQRELPVIFLPTHQSHMDYILLTFILFNYDIRAPHVAAGDNLQIPFFGYLMRSLGGYFIRRKLDGKDGKKDLIYRSVLHSYMQELLRTGQFFEFFIEGGRTRTGKALYPKGGLLSVIVDSYLEGVVPDVYLAPVSISYEKLLDGNFTTELQGLPKAQETFWRACSAIWRVVWGKFGNVRVDFGQPFSLKEYLAVCQSQIVASKEEDPFSPALSRSYNSNQSLFSEMATDDLRVTIQTLAQHVIHSCTSLRAIMSTHLLAFILLTKHRQGVSLDRLSVEVEELVEELRGRGRDVGFSGKTSDIILHACDLLGDHIVRIEQKNDLKKKNKREADDQNNNLSNLFIRPVMSMHRTLELSYYANALVPDYALESVIAFCILSELESQNWPSMWMAGGADGEDDTKPTVKKSELVTAAMHLIHLLHVEFIIRPPCESLETIIEGAIDKLLAWDVLKAEEQLPNREKAWANNFSRSMEFEEDDSDEEESTDFDVPDTVYMIQTDRHSLRRLRFLHSVLAPLMETYYTVMIGATNLATTPKTEREFITESHYLLMNRITNNIATYVESANQVTVKTAVQALRQLHLIEVKDATNNDTASKISELTVSNDAKEHMQRLLDLLVNYNPNPLGLPKPSLPVSA